ncbi:hypothetical protein HPB51_003807 [Rhipicephalus microplus]|uniref:GOLD domain-containing protein n=1 Tax=Rhipicephalus microplus TaxID=6941 RepID=A0A9J6EKV3_RHIMP|nr:hypothetical protein HPB51_003807 [Rhipicephalus microplus]
MVRVVRLRRKCAVLDLLFGAIVFATLLDISRTKDVFEDAETELTVTLRAGGIECFHQPAKVGQVLEVEYQVLDANFGNMEVQQNMDINFVLKSPTGEELIKEQSRTEAIHRHEVKELGDHTMCFDNSMSTVSSKTVYFEVYVDKTGGGSQEEDEWDGGDIPYSPELVYNDTYKDIKEHNFTRVNQFSMLVIVVMLVVGAVQVIMVRSLFEERSRLRKIFQYLS